MTPRPRLRRPVATVGRPAIKRYSTGVPVVTAQRSQQSTIRPMHSGLTAGQDLADYYRQQTTGRAPVHNGTTTAQDLQDYYYRYSREHPPAPGSPAAPAAPKYDSVPAQPTVQESGAYKDSDYFAWKAQRQAEINQQNIAWDAEEAGDASSRQEALRRMAIQRPEDLRKTDESYNDSGLFYSGQLGKARDTVEGNYARATADTNANYDSRHYAREAARRALAEGYSLEDAAQIAAAADRGIDRDTSAADANALVGPQQQAVSDVRAPTGKPNPERTRAAAQRARAKAQRQHDLALARARARRRPNRR